MNDDLRSLLIPFRRDQKNDFASGTGADLLKSKIEQALMTEGQTPRSSGELPWRVTLGSGLHLLRHQRNDDVLQELARVYVRDALKRWVPEVEVVVVDAVRDSAALRLSVRFRETQRAGSIETTTVQIVQSSTS
jgi:uncharacterized protein